MDFYPERGVASDIKLLSINQTKAANEGTLFGEVRYCSVICMTGLDRG